MQSANNDGIGTDFGLELAQVSVSAIVFPVY